MNGAVIKPLGLGGEWKPVVPTCEEEITFLGNFVYILLGSPETVKGTSVALPVVFCLFYLFFSLLSIVTFNGSLSVYLLKVLRKLVCI